MINQIKDKISGKVPAGHERSPHWPTFRKHVIDELKVCAVCGGTEKLELHHIKPFHLHPELELERTNVILLCESGANGIVCHRGIGHLGDYKSFNPNVVEDAKIWAEKIRTRPILLAS